MYTRIEIKDVLKDDNSKEATAIVTTAALFKKSHTEDMNKFLRNLTEEWVLIPNKLICEPSTILKFDRYARITSNIKIANIKRDCERLCSTFEFNFTEADDIARFNAMARDLIASFDK